ncbi:MAG: protein BatD [Bacteroidetes bacterium]|nr:protein BatD [Bacteroidota bacterium]
MKDSRHIGYRAPLLLALLVSVTLSLSAQVRFSASAPASVGINQNFQVDYTVENGSAKTIDPGIGSDFQILSGPNPTQQVQIMNGHMSQSVIYSYIVHPKKEGVFKIGRGKASIEGVSMESNELTITVTGPVQQQARHRRDPFNPFDDDDDPFAAMQQQMQQQMQQMQQAQQQPQQQPKSNADLDKAIRDNVIVRMETDRNDVYIGERISATIKIYFKMNIGNVSPTKAPSFDGFWSQEVMNNKQIKEHIETYNGQKYYAADLIRYNLYPQRAGALQITPAELNMIVQAEVGRSFWGPQYANVPYKTSSNAVTVHVKDVPAAGKPADYNGAVGKFKYEVKLSSAEGKTDDALTYTVRISGVGNLKTIELPKPQFPDGFETFDPKVKDDVTNTDAGMSGSIQYDYLIIPHQPGDFKIAGSSFSFFDPGAGKYFTQTSPELALKITGAPSQNPNTGTAMVSKEDVAALHSDIRFIKTKAELVREQKPFFGSVGFFGLVGTPFFAFIGLLFVRRRTEDLAADIVGAKRRRATRLARKRLSTADKHLVKGNKEAFYDEVSRAIWGYLGDKLNIDQSQLSKDNVEGKLLAKNVKADTIAKLKNLIHTCELALYSPVGAGDEMKQNYNAAIELIADLEDEIK